MFPYIPPSFCLCQVQVQSASIMLAAVFKSEGSHTMSFLVTIFKGKEKLQNKSFEVQKIKHNFRFFFFLNIKVP